MGVSILDNTFLVTGGAGLVGSHIADRLIEMGAAEVRILDNFTRGTEQNIESALSSDRCVLIRGDIRHPYEVSEAVAGVDAVFHQAAIRITRCASANRECLDVLVTGTFNILEACVSQGVKKLLLASSASVYGMADKFPTDEAHHPYNDKTLYGASKTANEAMARAFHDMHGLDYIALRPFNIYGPRMDATGKYTEVMIRWMDCIESGTTPLIFGDGRQTLDFIYVDDVARAYIAACESEISNRVYNVGSGKEVSLSDLLDATARAMGRPGLRPEYLEERSVNPVRRRCADITAIQNDLSWSPVVDLEKGLAELARWKRGLRR